MALPASGNSISMSQVNTELGRAATTTISLDDAVVRNLFGVATGSLGMAHGFGKSSLISKTAVAATNLNVSTLFVASDWTSATDKEVVIPAGVTIGSSSTASPAMTIPAGMGGKLTIRNSGSIQGAGGAANGGQGGDAILAQSSNITINNAGTIYAGGGGGGAGGTGGTGGLGGTGTYSAITSYNTVTEGPIYQRTTTPYSWWLGYIQICGNNNYSSIYWQGAAIVTGGTHGTSGQITVGAYTYKPAVFQANVPANQVCGAPTSAPALQFFSVTRSYQSPVYTTYYPAGGAGGNGGAGGSGGVGQGYGQTAAAGAGGSTGAGGAAGGTNAGTGGTGGTGGSGGTGGGWGASGGAGSTGNTGGSGANGNYSNGAAGTAGSGGSSGGAAGCYINGNSNVTWTALGTVAGRTA